MKYLAGIILIFSTHWISGQVNADSIFNSAIKNAQTGMYNQAIKEAQIVLNTHPDRFDVLVFMANIRAWTGEYEAAMEHIKKAYLLNKTYKELYDSWLNILLWAENYRKLLETCNLAEKNNYPDSYNICLKRTLAYKALNDYKGAINTLENNQAYLDSIPLKKLYNDLLMLNKSNAISVYYSIDFFEGNTIQPQHLSYIDYAFKINRHTLIPRVLYTHRFNLSDYQLEADYYHIFRSGNYLYANYGIGIMHNLFPQHRAGLEYYTTPIKTFELSAGVRMLYYTENKVGITTIQFGKYHKNFWFSIRPMYIIHETKNTWTTILKSRHYSSNPLNYIGLELMAGNSPDDRNTLLPSAEILLLNNYRAKIEKNIALKVLGELKLSAAYSYEEYIPSHYRSKFNFEILFKYKL